MASSSTIVNMDSQQQNSPSTKMPKCSSINWFGIFSWLAFYLAIALIVLSYAIFQPSWKMSNTSTFINTCLHPRWNNTNYQFTILLSSFTLGPLIIFECLFLMIFIGWMLSCIGFKITKPKQYPLWLEWTAAVVSMLTVTSLIIAYVFTSLILANGRPVQLPDGRVLECDQPIANYFSEFDKLSFLFPPFALIAAVYLLLFSTSLWEHSRGRTNASTTLEATSFPLDLIV